MILAEVAYNIQPVLLAQLVGIIVFFVIAYYFAKFLVIKLTPLVLKIKREEEAKQNRGQDDQPAWIFSTCMRLETEL